MNHPIRTLHLVAGTTWTTKTVLPNVWDDLILLFDCFRQHLSW